DGSKVPLNIIRRKGTKLDGNNPVLLYGYGGYAINLQPNYNPALRPMLDRGVVYVIANLRGGGEYGETCQRAGMLKEKQKGFADVKEPDHIRALHTYSPYHHVTDRAQYPAVLFLTGANDPRVDPSHARKMTARLQNAGNKQLVLLRTTSEAGHGIGTALSE